MYRITPIHPAAKDAMTGETLPEKGVLREVLIPPDHYAERTGDIKITEENDPPAAVAEKKAGK
jgi:hypothetical protein